VRRLAEVLDSGLPYLSFDSLFHVGTMDPGQKRRGSLEGAGLSVSEHPDEWRQIGKGLVSGNTWELTKPGNKFLDAHALSEDQREEIVDWGLSKGYIEEAKVFRVTGYDDEYSSETYSDYYSRKEAEDEAFDDEEVTEIDSFKATPSLVQASQEGSDDYFNLLLPIFVETLPGFDGVWWDDLLDPYKYSAPRGVILVSRLGSWNKEISE
jgi:hypothetical protein